MNDSIFNKQRSKIELIASLITIIVFVSGISSIPSLFFQNKDTGIIVHINRTSISVGLILISQVAYFVSFYIIIQYLRYKVLPERRQRFSLSDNPRASFMAIILFFLGMGISFLFLEGFWGPIENLKNSQTGTSFGILSFILNLATVVLGLELQLD